MFLDEFIVSESNRSAYNSCIAFAGAPQGKLLVISGESHCGKSHLAHIIERNYREDFTHNKTFCCSCDAIVNEYINSLESGSATNVENTVCANDLLILDNFQFVAGRQATEKLFARWFTKMLAENKSVVIITDRAPKALDNIHTAFEVVHAHLLTPDVGLRRTYVSLLAKKYSLSLPISVKNYLACSLSISFSALSGYFKKLALIASTDDENKLTEHTIIDTII